MFRTKDLAATMTLPPDAVWHGPEISESRALDNVGRYHASLTPLASWPWAAKYGIDGRGFAWVTSKW